MEEVTDIDKQLEPDKSPHWCAIIRVNNQRALFRVPIVEGDAGWIDSIDSFAHDARTHFDQALRGSKCRLVFGECRGSMSSDIFSVFLRDMITLDQREFPLHGRVAIMDFTRTSLPQISGKAARDAFAMAHYLGRWEESRKKYPINYSTYLGFGRYALVYDGKTWSKPGDMAEQYYENLREEHPLVLFWRHKSGLCIVHPDYEPKET